MGEGEEAAPTQRAAQPTAHQTHPHLLCVSGVGWGGLGWGGGAGGCILMPPLVIGTNTAVVSVSAGQCEPSQVRFIKECVKTSPGLRVTGSSGPHMEERTSLSTSLSESHTCCLYSLASVFYAHSDDGFHHVSKTRIN